MAADPLSEHLVLSEEPPAESTPAMSTRQAHHYRQAPRHEQLQQPQPPPTFHPGTQASSPESIVEHDFIPQDEISRLTDGATYKTTVLKSAAASPAQITVNPAASASLPQGYHGGTDHRLRTAYHHAESTASRFHPSTAAAATATAGLRFNVVQQQHGKHITSELVPVTEDAAAAATAARYTTRTGAVNNNSNNNGLQVLLPNAPGGGDGGGDRGVGPHSTASSSIGRKQLLEDTRAAAAKSVDIGE